MVTVVGIAAGVVMIMGIVDPQGDRHIVAVVITLQGVRHTMGGLEGTGQGPQYIPHGVPGDLIWELCACEKVECKGSVIVSSHASWLVGPAFDFLDFWDRLFISYT